MPLYLVTATKRLMFSRPTDIRSRKQFLIAGSESSVQVDHCWSVSSLHSLSTTRNTKLMMEHGNMQQVRQFLQRANLILFLKLYSLLTESPVPRPLRLTEKQPGSFGTPGLSGTYEDQSQTIGIFPCNHLSHSILHLPLLRQSLQACRKAL